MNLTFRYHFSFVLVSISFLLYSSRFRFSCSFFTWLPNPKAFISSIQQCINVKLILIIVNSISIVLFILFNLLAFGNFNVCEKSALFEFTKQMQKEKTQSSNNNNNNDIDDDNNINATKFSFLPLLKYFANIPENNVFCLWKIMKWNVNIKSLYLFKELWC